MGQALLPYLILGGAQVGSSALGSALTPSPYQHKNTFEGTGADPSSWLADIRASTGNALNAMGNRANEPITIGDNVNIQPGPTFSGGGLPMALSSPTSMPQRLTVGGFGIGPMGNGSQSSLPVSSFVPSNLKNQPHTAQNVSDAQDVVSNFVNDPRIPDWYRNTINQRIGQARQNAPAASPPPTATPGGANTQGLAAARLLQHALGQA